MKKYWNATVAVGLSLILLCASLTGCGSSDETKNTDTSEPSVKNSENTEKSPLSENEKKPESNKHIDIGGDSSEESDDNSQTEEVNFYFFEYNNVKIAPKMLMNASVATALGEYQYLESSSCAYMDLDKIYSYGGFVVYTHSESDGDRIHEILIGNDTVTTPEGLLLGASREDVIAAYGEDYTALNESFSYRKGDTELRIIMKNGKVISIQYWDVNAL